MASECAFPDQIIELGLVGIAQLERSCVGLKIGWADTLVRLLGVLGFVLVDTWLFGDVFVTKACGNRSPGFCYGLGGHVDTIGPHICDVTRFIEALCCAHTGARTHAKLAGCLLLKR